MNDVELSSWIGLRLLAVAPLSLALILLGVERRLSGDEVPRLIIASVSWSPPLCDSYLLLTSPEDVADSYFLIVADTIDSSVATAICC